ncbi:MAG: phenylacetate-CoA oxygenase subunit PaaJ [Calditrichaeota bacterium]|nr:phenylacetate-CoA oxygenase subunit PaaJ [Calditrichota bacterium]
MVIADQSIEEIYQVLDTVKDPEVPVLSLIELGVIRDVHFNGEIPVVVMTPTYSGCPALKVMETDIRSALKQIGYDHIEIKQILSPAWTTDWLSEESKAKLNNYGIAPPCMRSVPEIIKCPLCHSSHTKRQSEFGATACKALYVCQECKEPFEYFKAI